MLLATQLSFQEYACVTGNSTVASRIDMLVLLATQLSFQEYACAIGNSTVVPLGVENDCLN